MDQRTVDLHAVEVGAKPGEEPSAQTGEARPFLRHLAGADLRSLAEAHDPGNVQRARAQAVLVPAPVDLAAELNLGLLPAHVQRTLALRPVVLVPRERQEVHTGFVDVDRHLAGSLRRVGVQQRPGLVHEASDVGHKRLTSLKLKH